MHDDMMNRSPDKHEAAMARADLYKLANYSMKLFKMIHEGQELEGWVQAKITKAADYVASVYHFMEYEMKSSDYGSKLENSDVYSESVRKAFEQKLMEAKKQAEKIKAKAEKMDEGWDDMLKAVKDRSGPQPSGGSGIKKGSRYGGSKQKADDTEKDDEDEKPKKDKKVKESSKPDYLDFDKDGNKKEPMKKALKDKKVKEDTRLAMRRGPGADMLRYEKDSPAPGAKKHRDDTAKAAKELRASGKKLGDQDDAKVGDKTVTRYSREKSVKEVAMSPAPVPNKTGIPNTAKTTVPGMRATQQDLKKANSSAALGEGKCNQTMEGKSCPVHGMKECGSMSEAKNLKQQAAIAIAKKKAK